MFQAHIGEIKLIIMQWICMCMNVREVQYWRPGDVPRTLPYGYFLGRLENIHTTLLQNCENMQLLTFQYFPQYIWWRGKIENNTTIMCFIIYFQIDVLWTSRGHRGRHFRTLLGRPWDFSPQFMRNWQNVIAFSSWWYAESKSIR